MLLLLGLPLGSMGQDALPTAAPSVDSAPTLPPEPTPKIDDKMLGSQSSVVAPAPTNATVEPTTDNIGTKDAVSLEDGFTDWVMKKLVEHKDVWTITIAFGALVVSAFSLGVSTWIAWRTAMMMDKQGRVMECQTTAQLNALSLQARLTQLNQVKLRLETLMCGDTMSLRDNALPAGATQVDAQALSEEQKAWVGHVVNQICGDAPDEKHKALVTDLATQWMLLEQSMQDAYAEVERTLAARA